MTVLATCNKVPAAPQSFQRNSASRIPPFLQYQEASWRYQVASGLFGIPTEILGVIGKMLFSDPDSFSNHLGIAVSNLAMTCRAGYTFALHLCNGLDKEAEQEHCDDQLCKIELQFLRAQQKPSSDILQRAVLFIQAQAPTATIELGPLLQLTDEASEVLLTPQTLEYLPAIQVELCSRGHAVSFANAVRSQLVLPVEQRSQFSIEVQACQDLDLCPLIAAADAHGKVEFHAPGKLTATVVQLLEEEMIAEYTLHDQCDARLFDDFMAALKDNLSLKSLVAHCDKERLDRLLKGLRESSLEVLTFIPADTTHSGKELADFVRNHLPLKKLVIQGPEKYRSGEQQSPAQCKAAALELVAAINERKSACPGFTADIQLDFFRTGHNTPRDWQVVGTPAYEQRQHWQARQFDNFA